MRTQRDKKKSTVEYAKEAENTGTGKRFITRFVLLCRAVIYPELLAVLNAPPAKFKIKMINAQSTCMI